MLTSAGLVLAFWPFGSALMLLWGLAALAPIIIHLWNRRKYREVAWAAMEYLLAAMRKNARRVRIEQLLLLAVRVLILVLLAIALADPVISALPALRPGSAVARTHYVLVIDGSYSMDRLQGENRLFDEARRQAAELVQQGAQGDGFTLLLMADPPATIIRQPAFDPADVLEELSALQMTHGGADLGVTLAEVERMLEQAERKHPSLTRAQVCFFTDLGATTWDDVANEDCRARVGRIAERAGMRLVALDASTDENLAVADLSVGHSLLTVADATPLQATIRNFGRQDAKEASLEFLVDERVVHSERVNVPAGGQAAVTWTEQFEAPGEHTIEARLAADGLSVDNHRWLSVPVRESLRVLCVSGKIRAARHLAYALQPLDDDESRVITDIRPESALLELNLHDYDAIFLCNVGRFGRDEAALLYDYVNGGGGLVVTLGDQVQTDNYNREIGADSERRLLPARLGELVDESQYSLDPLNYEHPIVQPFRDHERTGLLTTPVWTYVQLTPVDDADVGVAIAFDTGDPALLDESIGMGQSILLATAASPLSVNSRRSPPTPWTALATWPSFVPLVQEVLAHAVRGREQHRNVDVGEPLTGVLRGRVSGVDLSVAPPRWPEAPVAGGTAERVQMDVDGEDSRWVFTGTRKSGVYAARYGEPLDDTRFYGVNLDTRESSPRRLDAELLPSQFLAAASEPSEVIPSSAGTNSRQLFRYALAGVLLLLLTESVLAWLFGRSAA